MAKNITIEDLLPELEQGKKTPTTKELQDDIKRSEIGAGKKDPNRLPNVNNNTTEEELQNSGIQSGLKLFEGNDPFRLLDPVDGRIGTAQIINYFDSLGEDFPSFVDTTKTSIEADATAIGRMLRIIPENVYGSNVFEYTSNVEPSKNFVFVSDAFRGRAANYWAVNRAGTGIEYVSEKREASQSIPYAIRYGPLHNLSDLGTDFGVGSAQWIKISGDRNKFTTGKIKNGNEIFSRDLWKAYVTGGTYKGTTKRGTIEQEFSPVIVPAQPFTDHVHQMPLPFSRKELDKFSSPLNALSAQIRPEYNFYWKSYETKIMEDPTVLENTLPNIYVFISETNQEQPNPEFKKLITLDESIRPSTDRATSLNKFTGIFNNKKRKFDIKTHPIGKYYNNFAKQYNVARDKGAVTSLSEKFSNILVSSGDISLLKDFNEKREMFPMYVDIEFSTDKATTFAQILKDSNLSEAFMTRVANRIIDNEALLMSCQEVIEDVAQERGENPVKNSTLSGKQKRYWNVTDIIKNLIEVQEDLNPSATYLGDYANTEKTLSGKQYDFFKSIMFRIFSGKLKKLVKDKFRSFRDIMNGKPAYSETVFYRVAKYAGDVDGELIQNYYFPNSNELDVLRFIDTQVKYDKQYTYVVFAYQLVFGNKYSYTEPGIENLKNNAVFEVFNFPDLALFEHEFYRFTGKVLDDPPIAPDIDVVPYKGIDDRVLILMNGNVGNVVQDPIFIKTEDQELVENFRKERQLEPGSPIRFKADDHVGKFEVYRLEKHPESYSDFKDGLRTVVDVEESGKMATAGSFIDKIEPNKRYYYTFRGIDVHDNFSNPTPIIRIEMINENGTVFLLKDVVDFAEEPKVSSKQARRYIQLVPSVLQSLINEEKSGYDEALSATQVARQIHLGETDETVWGKNFKIRLTSKSTGKKVDFFVKFEHEHKEKA